MRPSVIVKTANYILEYLKAGFMRFRVVMVTYMMYSLLINVIVTVFKVALIKTGLSVEQKMRMNWLTVRERCWEIFPSYQVADMTVPRLQGKNVFESFWDWQ